MSGQFLHRMFGDAARAFQERGGSRASYARLEAQSGDAADALTERELGFIAARDSVFLATVTVDGWPYVQHRGGPPGFIRNLGGNRLAIPNYPGNRQYVSAGNLVASDRIALIGLDYAARRRLKLIGHAQVVTADADPALIERLGGGGEDVIAALVLNVIAFDWNCPKYITQRFTAAEVDQELIALRAENASLRAAIAQQQEKLQ